MCPALSKKLLLLFTKLSCALLADCSSLELYNAVSLTAENAGSPELFKNDLIVIRIDLNCILNSEVISSSELDRQYDPSEFVDLSYNTC